MTLPRILPESMVCMVRVTIFYNVSDPLLKRSGGGGSDTQETVHCLCSLVLFDL